jgi:hypothetical protein
MLCRRRVRDGDGAFDSSRAIYFMIEQTRTDDRQLGVTRRPQARSQHPPRGGRVGVEISHPCGPSS